MAELEVLAKAGVGPIGGQVVEEEYLGGSETRVGPSLAGSFARRISCWSREYDQLAYRQVGAESDGCRERKGFSEKSCRLTEAEEAGLQAALVDAVEALDKVERRFLCFPKVAVGCEVRHVQGYPQPVMSLRRFKEKHDRQHLQRERGSSRKKKAYTRDDDAVELDEVRATPCPRRLVSQLVRPKRAVPVVVLSSVRHVKPGSVRDKGQRVIMLSWTKKSVRKDVL